MKRTAAALLVMATVIPVTAHAQSIAGSLGDLQKLLKPGQVIVVTDTAGRRTTGTFITMLGDSLVLSIPEERRFPESAIAKVKRSDPLWNGTLIGGLVLGTWCALVCGQGLDSRNQLLPVVMANAGFGALIGLGMDAMIRPQLLYMRAGSVGRPGADKGPAEAGYDGRGYGISFSWRY